jgi:hypothetical protein
MSNEPGWPSEQNMSPDLGTKAVSRQGDEEFFDGMHSIHRMGILSILL